MPSVIDLVDAEDAAFLKNEQKLQTITTMTLLLCHQFNSDATKTLSGEADDAFVLHQHWEQLANFKNELSDIWTSLLSVDLEDDDQLSRLLNSLDKVLFDCFSSTKKL